MSDVTHLLTSIEKGEPHAAEQLLPHWFMRELRHKLAAQRLAHEKPGQTLQATALVHEAYLRLVVNPGGALADKKEPCWNSFSRAFFFAAAAAGHAERILVERARHKDTSKAGGGKHRVDLDALDPAIVEPGVDVLALDEALEKLAKKDPRKADLVNLRYFAGLTVDQAAEMLGISPSTADNDWAYARAWLRLELMGDQSTAS